MEIKNAIIEKTTLGKEDHGIMTAFLTLNYGGSGQGFGGYSFDRYDKKQKRRIGSSYGCEFIMRVLKVVGVNNWEDLEGKHIRVKADSGKVYAIGNIIEDEWFSPEDLYEELKEK